MSATHLVVVPPSKPEAAEAISDRIRRLQAEARTMAREHIDLLRATLAEAARLAREITDGGDAYPVGAREVSRRVAEEAAHQAMTLTAINDRAVN